MIWLGSTIPTPPSSPVCVSHHERWSFEKVNDSGLHQDSELAWLTLSDIVLNDRNFKLFFQTDKLWIHNTWNARSKLLLPNVIGGKKKSSIHKRSKFVFLVKYLWFSKYYGYGYSFTVTDNRLCVKSAVMNGSLPSQFMSHAFSPLPPSSFSTNKGEIDLNISMHGMHAVPRDL